jgi:hypothetical protein
MVAWVQAPIGASPRPFAQRAEPHEHDGGLMSDSSLEGPADGGAEGTPGVQDGGADGAAEGPADGGAEGTPGVQDGGADGGAEGPADGGADGTPGVSDGGADGSA